MEFCFIDEDREANQVIGRKPNEEELQAVYDGDATIIRYHGNRFQFLVVDEIKIEDEEDSETVTHWTNAYEKKA